MRKQLTLMLCLMLIAACSMTPNVPIQPARSVELEDYVAKLRKVSVTIDGKAYDFLFDTGGGYTLVAPEILDAAGCHPHGKLTGYRMHGERLDFSKCGEVTFALGGETFRVEAGQFDINSLLPDHLPPLYGVISMATFKQHAITLDLANNRLVVENPSSLQERVTDMSPLEVNFYNELEGRGLDIYLRVNTTASETYLLLDSGNLGGNLLNPETWQEIANTDQLPETGSSHQIEFDFGTAGRVELPAKVADIIREGALDVNFVESAVFTFDIPNRRAWIRFHESRGNDSK